MKVDRKKLRWVFILACLLFAGLLGAALLVPRLIDLQSVRAKIEQAVSRETGGTISFERIEVAVFPRPRAVFHKTALEIPGRVSGTISRLEAFPRIMPLLRGAIEISGVHLDGADLVIVIPKQGDGGKEKASLETLQKKLIALSAKAAGLSASVSGSALLLKHEGEEIRINGLDARISAGPGNVRVNLDASTEFTGKVSLRAGLSPEKFTGEGELRISRLQTRLAPRRVMPDVLAAVAEAEGDLRVRYRAEGIEDLKVEAAGSFPRLKLRSEDGSAELKVKSLDAEALFKGRDVVVTVKDFRLDRPGLGLKGKLSIDNNAGKVSLDIKGEDFDVTAIREAALALAPEVPVVRNIFRYVEGGAIPRISFSSAGPTLRDLGKTDNFRIDGKLQNGIVFVPGPALRITDVTADAVIEKGILIASKVVSSMQKIRGSEGSVRVGLKGKDAPLHIETTVRADAGEVHGLLTRLIKNEGVARELGRISSMSGSLEGRLVLGEQVNAVAVIADVTNMKFSAAYDRLPSALAIESGRVHYDRALIRTEELGGSIGKTTFSNLNGQVTLEGEPSLELRNGTASIDLDTIFPWISSSAGAESFVRKLRTTQGRLEISSAMISGPFQDPGRWTFRASAVPKEVVLSVEGLPSRLGLDSGTVQATQERIDFSGMTVQLLDASFRLSGSLAGYLHDLSRVECSGEGSAGARFTEWAFGEMKLSDVLKPQAKIKLTNARAAWEKDKKTVFQGTMELPAGLQADLRVVTGPEELLLEVPRARDALSDALFSLNKTGREIALGFKGRLSQKTLDTLVKIPGSQAAWIEGGFSARFPLDDLSAGTVQGDIRGEHLPVHAFGIDTIDRLSLSGNDREVRVAFADFSYAGSSFKVSGKLGVVKNALSLDLDVLADRIVWDEIAKQTDRGKAAGGPSETKKKPLQIEGSLRLKTEKFLYHGSELSPVDAVIQLKPDATRVTIIKAGFCSVGVSGDLGFYPGGTDLDITLEAKDQEFKPTVICLSKSRGDASGTFTLHGRFKGRGAADELKKAVNGNVMFSARDGRITKYRTLDSVFDFINGEEQLKGQVPDLEKEELTYRLLMVRGEVDKGILLVQEGVLDSGSVEIVAQGSVDLIEGGLDLNLLVAPLRQLNRVVGKIPVVGTILGGSLISVPVKVSGTTAEPKVSYLSASATVSNLTGMMSRTLELPLNIFSPFMSKDKEKGPE